MQNSAPSQQKKLRTWWPFSLRYQIILLIVFAIGSVQLMNFYMAREFRMSYQQNVIVNHLSTTIRVLRSALAEIPHKEHQDFVVSASHGQWSYVVGPLPDNSYNTWRRGQRRLEGCSLRPHRAQNMEQRLAYRPGKMLRQLNQEFNDGTHVALSRGRQPALFISLIPSQEPETNDQQQPWLVVPLNRIDVPDITHLYIAWALTSLLLLVLSLFFSWYITRPLSRLNQAVQQYSQGQTVYVKPSGPRETRALGHSFNHMLQSLQESKAVQQTLLAGLPHDLKSPLARLWLRLEMTDDESLKDGMRKDLQEMQAIINQFISYVRGADPSSYQLEPIDIKSWLEERVRAWQETGTEIQLHSLDLAANTQILADKLSIDRLLDNLIGNALKHGKPPIEIHAHNLAESNELHLSIVDHGEGIAPEQRADALRAFSRLDEARTKTGSVGLGLAVVEQIVLSHQGRLELNSHKSGGLCVDIYLPLA